MECFRIYLGDEGFFVERDMGFFPYMGGDGLIAKKIGLMLPRGDEFFEVFGGGGSVTYYLASVGSFRRLVLNDADPNVYALYYFIKYCPHRFAEVKAFFDRTLEERRKKKKSFKERLGVLYREMNEVRDWEERGLRATIIFLSVQKFNGTSGMMLRNTDRPDTGERIWRYLFVRHERMKQVEIMNRDGLELIKENDRSGVVMYLDPPHVGYNFYSLNFEEEDARRLAKTLSGLSHAKVLLKLTWDNEQYYDVLRGWHRVSMRYKTQTPSNAKGKKKITRYVFLANYEIGLRAFFGKV